MNTLGFALGVCMLVSPLICGLITIIGIPAVLFFTLKDM